MTNNAEKITLYDIIMLNVKYIKCTVRNFENTKKDILGVNFKK